MQKNDMKRTLIECVGRSLALETSEIKLNSRLIDDLGADSLDFMDIMFQLEDAFGVKLQKEDLNFLMHIGMELKDAVVDEYLTVEAKQRLRRWMPALEVSESIKPGDLSHYLTLESLQILVEKKKG
jgi:acyl carrier protein